jgi:hypothetical protein
MTTTSPLYDHRHRDPTVSDLLDSSDILRSLSRSAATRCRDLLTIILKMYRVSTYPVNLVSLAEATANQGQYVDRFPDLAVYAGQVERAHRRFERFANLDEQ